MQTSKHARTILVGEDEPEVAGYFEMALKCLGYSIELAQDGDEVLACFQSSRSEIAAVLLDIMMPNRDGLDTLRALREMDPHVPVIMVSGSSSSFNIVTAMKCGATDFLCKPVAHEDLGKAVSRALEMKDKDVVYTLPSRNTTPATNAYMSTDPRMQEIQALIREIGWSEVPVLIQGETGSGKEVLGRELHAQSPRSNKPFLNLNCAAVPSELVESELFGYERGAFTGAFQKKAGLFELADGGTILLDEIGDTDVRLQAKLLQVLQDYEFHRIGGKEIIKVDVRVIAATHRDLEKAITDRTFREDLYYRVDVINIQLPPLRERKEDIIPLSTFLLRKHSVNGVPAPSITQELKHAMLTYQWPGNVRELENFMRNLVVLRNPEMLARELHVKSIRKPLLSAHAAPVQQVDERVEKSASAPILEQVTKAKEEAEMHAILAALNSTRWNRKQAAALLKIDYKALLYKMKKLCVEEKAAAPVCIEPERPAKTAAGHSA